MSQTWKVVAALVFVTVLGWVLLQPVFDAVEIDAVDGTAENDTGNGTRPTGSSETSPSEEPTPEPSPSEEEVAGLPEEFRTKPLWDRYPTACFEAAEPGPEPLVAAVDAGGRVRFGTPSGPTRPGPEGGATLGRVEMIHGFNSAGDLYAAGSRKQAFIAPPEGSQGADGESRLGRLRSVAWSPRGGCGVAVDGKGSLVVVPDDGAGQLVRDDVRSAAFSADGRKLAVVLEEDEATSLWVASLTGDRMREVYRDRRDAGIEIEAWAPQGGAIYLVLGEQQGLSFVTLNSPPMSGRVSVDPIDQLRGCGDRVLGIMSGAIVEVTERGPHFLAASERDYRYLSCAPNGAFIAAIGDEGLVLLDGDGNFLRDLTQDSGYTDVFVDWGEAGSGLIFGRVPSDGDPVAAELWHLAEGGSARPTGLTYRGGRRAVDWAASPPTGLP